MPLSAIGTSIAIANGRRGSSTRSNATAFRARCRRKVFQPGYGRSSATRMRSPASSDLNDQIKQALAASHNLIVICSPNTPQSRWVSREIELFQEMGRADRVLALLIDGEPDQSFPAVMRHRRRAEGDASAVPAEEIEPIAADVRHRRDLSTRKVKRFALLRLVAALIAVTVRIGVQQP